jgi:hypothetical protein
MSEPRSDCTGLSRRRVAQVHEDFSRYGREEPRTTIETGVKATTAAVFELLRK